MEKVFTSAIHHPQSAILLKRVLQRELHNSWRSGSSDLAESRTAYFRAGVTGPETVGQVVSLSTKFQFLHFANVESSRKRRVEIEGTGSLQVVTSLIRVGAESRYGVSIRVEVNL